MAKKEEKEKKLKIRILPLRGIGGIGKAGDTALLPEDEAEYWVKEGYAEIIAHDEAEVVPSSVASPDGDKPGEDAQGQGKLI